MFPETEMTEIFREMRYKKMLFLLVSKKYSGQYLSKIKSEMNSSQFTGLVSVNEFSISNFH